MLEREIKQLLTEEEYLKILGSEDLQNSSKHHHMQINYYYDTDDYQLHQQGITLRVRQKGAKLSLEMKTPFEVRDGYKVKKEETKRMDQLKSVIWLAQEFDSAPIQVEVRLIQPLITERTHFQISEHIQVDLDKNSYLGLVDYELEIEFDEGHEQEALHLFQILCPNRIAQPSGGKNSRFFQQYFQMLRNQQADKGRTTDLWVNNITSQREN
ncbi:CYTH domain-containing protein [Paenibacillus sp. SI8]|uniref:CYTH domain-containing protein n=1 Tax=unclassified Paenibacillus TaxID=185978 RepID=UPI003465BFD4